MRSEIPLKTFQLWVEPLRPVRIEESEGGRQIRLAAPSSFHVEMVQDRLRAPLQNGLRTASDEPLDVSFTVVDDLEQMDRQELEVEEPDADMPSGMDQNQVDLLASSEGSAGLEGPAGVAAYRPETVRSQIARSVETASTAQADVATVADAKQAPRDSAPSGGQSGSRNDSTAPAAERPSQTQREEVRQMSEPTREGPPGEPPRQPSVRHELQGAHSASTVGRFRPSYTFDQFIEGDCNQLARSAALAIANNPNATSYNPFLVYGGVGLGKTHLAQAIGNRIYGDEPGRAVVYVSSEEFTSQFVRSIQRNSVADFTAFYRQIDVLIVDDVQFFSGKEKTQEEFFHVFNTLHQDGKQIVLCADRPPRAIDGIEERLLSRFQWGLSADVQQPDFETRLAILQAKAELLDVTVPSDVLDYIAHHVQDSIRNLEGALSRLKAHFGMSGDDLTVRSAKHVLRDIVSEQSAHVSVSSIMDVIASYYRLDENALPGRSRKQQVVKARQLAMYLAREFTEKSLSSIGDHFGGRDHSTVIHSINAIEDRLDTEASFRQEHDDVRRALRSQGAAV